MAFYILNYRQNKVINIKFWDEAVKTPGMMVIISSLRKSDEGADTDLMYGFTCLLLEVHVVLTLS